MSSPLQAPAETSRRTSSSLSFLRRSKSKEAFGDRKVSGSRKISGGRLTKKQQAESDRERESQLQQLLQATPIPPLKLPAYFSQAHGDDSEGSEIQADSVAIISNHAKKMAEPRAVQDPDRSVFHKIPLPALPNSDPIEAVDPSARVDSMTHRGRYSYASSFVSTVNSPRRMRKRKDPTPYNVLVIGARKSGKTSFVNFLKSSLATPNRPIRGQDESYDVSPQQRNTSRDFTRHYLVTEIDGERVGVTLWDSQGLEKNVVDLQVREVNSFLESKFEDTFTEETKVVRAPGLRDTHIHCVFLILDPVHLDANVEAAKQTVSDRAVDGRYNASPRIIGGLDEDFELQVLRALRGKTTVVPVISKADTITTAHMAFLKKTVSDSLQKTGIDPLEVLGLVAGEEDDDGQGRLEERDEEKEKARTTKVDHDGTPRDDDSDVVPLDQPTPIAKQVVSAKHRSTSSVSSFQSIEAHLPLSVLSPDSYSLNPLDGAVGRKFPWGFADPYNPEHCDFVKLKESCFGEWRGDFREASRERFYERWRTNRLNRKGLTTNGGGSRPAEKRGGMPNGILKGRN